MTYLWCRASLLFAQKGYTKRVRPKNPDVVPHRTATPLPVGLPRTGLSWVGPRRATQRRHLWQCSRRTPLEKARPPLQTPPHPLSLQANFKPCWIRANPWCSVTCGARHRTIRATFSVHFRWPAPRCTSVASRGARARSKTLFRERPKLPSLQSFTMDCQLLSTTIVPRPSPHTTQTPFTCSAPFSTTTVTGKWQFCEAAIISSRLLLLICASNPLDRPARCHSRYAVRFTVTLRPIHHLQLDQCLPLVHTCTELTPSTCPQLPAVSHGDPVAGPDCDAEENEDRYQRRAAVFDTPPTEIIPNLLLGGQKDAENPELLRRLGVSAVLNVTPESPARSHGPEIFYKQLPVCADGRFTRFSQSVIPRSLPPPISDS